MKVNTIGQQTNDRTVIETGIEQKQKQSLAPGNHNTKGNIFPYFTFLAVESTLIILSEL